MNISKIKNREGYRELLLKIDTLLFHDVFENVHGLCFNAYCLMFLVNIKHPEQWWFLNNYLFFLSGKMKIGRQQKLFCFLTDGEQKEQKNSAT